MTPNLLLTMTKNDLLTLTPPPKRTCSLLIVLENFLWISINIVDPNFQDSESLCQNAFAICMMWNDYIELVAKSDSSKADSLCRAREFPLPVSNLYIYKFTIHPIQATQGRG